MAELHMYSLNLQFKLYVIIPLFVDLDTYRMRKSLDQNLDSHEFHR